MVPGYSGLFGVAVAPLLVQAAAFERPRLRTEEQFAMTLIAAIVSLFWASTASLPSQQSVEARGLAIATETDMRQSGFGDSASQFSMILRDSRGGEKIRELRSRVLEGSEDGDKSVAIFESPPDVRGTAILTYAHKTDDDDQWLYLPALKRVKRIASANKSGPFMGSEFTYEDLANQEVEKYTYRWVRDERCPSEEYGSLTCFVVESYPMDEDSGYSRLTTWIDQLEYRPLQIEYHDRRDNFLKTLILAEHEQYLGRIWRADKMIMSNHQSGKSTELSWTNYEFGVGLTDNDFNPRSLTRIR